MASDHGGIQLVPVLALLGAAVVAGPLFKRLGFGSVLGYLTAGIVIGPFGIRVLNDPTAILHVAELGVVLFLFIIGLEMRPARLWGLRQQIFGLGLIQVITCSALLTGSGVLLGFAAIPAFIAASGFVLTSTAIVMQILEERRSLSSPPGQQIVSILLLEDLAIVPLLALVAVLAALTQSGNETAQRFDGWGLVSGVAAVAGIIVTGRYFLNPLFKMLASSGSRDIMTAAALLVVLGAAYAMQQGGLSMAMGAFLAGVLLSGSAFRHQLEMDVEPFRGTLLGLFFLAVGMSLDLGVVLTQWQLVALLVAAYMFVKALVIYGIARLLKSPHVDAVQRAIFMAQGGEFAFVLFSAALDSNLITAQQNATITAVVIVSMMLTPLSIAAMNFIQRLQRDPVREGPNGLTGSVLLVGFGRVGQVVAQFMMARGHSISIIDVDVEMIDVAADFGFRVFYGDGTRLDILHAAGAGKARAVVVCVDRPRDCTRIVELIKSEFPAVAVAARATDRRHSLDLMRAGADVQIRETFESAVLLGGAVLERLGAQAREIEEITTRIRDRDNQRLQRELTGGQSAGKAFFRGEPERDDLSSPGQQS